MVRFVTILTLSSVLFAGCVKTQSSDTRAEMITRPVIEQNTAEEPVNFEAMSLLGEPLQQQRFSPRELRRRQQELDRAKSQYEKYPDSLDFIIEYGQKLASTSAYQEALTIYSEGIARYPESYRLHRHRGHRFITTRKFDKAISDLEKAAFYIRGEDVQLEESSEQQLASVTTQFNIWYHLGLAYYLKGNYDKAISAYKKCMEVSTTDDLKVATSDWLYMTYRKIGNRDAANALLEPIKRNMRIVQNKAYHRRLLMYKGELEPESLLEVNVTDEASELQMATQGYGVGNWYMINGQLGQAEEIFLKVMDTDYWPAFGYIASEVEINNLALIAPTAD